MLHTAAIRHTETSSASVRSPVSLDTNSKWFLIMNHNRNGMPALAGMASFHTSKLTLSMELGVRSEIGNCYTYEVWESTRQGEVVWIVRTRCMMCDE